MTNLAGAARRLLAAGESAMLVTVAHARGSSPRNTGAAMLVTQKDLIGTVGGGRLEFEATELARAPRGGSLTEMALGPALGQCCGGNVLLLIEPVTADVVQRLADLEGEPVPAAMVTRLTDPLFRQTLAATDESPLRAAIQAAIAAGEPTTTKDSESKRWLIEPIGDRRPLVLLFGAGHVGKAIATALAPLPCKLRWIDQRAEMFPPTLPADTTAETPRNPVDLVAEAPVNTCFLVMTHTHDMDFQICEAVLSRDDFAYVGLIGSSTKRKQFERRMIARGFEPSTLAKLVCPIGIAGTTDKQPAVIAALTAAQLLLIFEGRR
ncbi:MAG: xanthine dehydrogenase accessory protein XdhC [Alphaproteobacteria bacterium]